MARNSGGVEFLSGLVVGGLLGVVVGFLLAPQSGEETRAQLMDRGIELRGELKKRAENVREKAPAFIEEQRGRVAEAVEKGKQAAAKKQRDILSQFEQDKRAGETAG